MAYASSITQISLGDHVRFTEERLSVLTPPDRKRLLGRMGVVQGYWNYSRKLTVYFPEDGGRRELRILSVDPRQLEPVAATLIDTEIEAANLIDTEIEIEPAVAEAPSGDETLSQEDMDNLFA